MEFYSRKDRNKDTIQLEQKYNKSISKRKPELKATLKVPIEESLLVTTNK